MTGYISIQRKLREHWLYKEDRAFSKFEAWIDILYEVNHTDNKFLFDGSLVEVKRGSTITSLRKMSEKWKWSITKVNTFLKTLEDDEMLVVKKDTKKTLLTVVNYDFYQSEKCKKEQQSNTEVTQKETNNNELIITNNELIIINNEKESKKHTLVCDDEFERFWLLYDKKVGKPICIKKWNKISKEDKELIFKNLPAYIKSTPDKQYRKDPATWLNQECWNDELIERDKTTGTSGDDNVIDLVMRSSKTIGDDNVIDLIMRSSGG